MRQKHPGGGVPGGEFQKFIETGQLKYNADQLGALQARLAGSISVPYGPDYDAKRQAFMNTFQQYPQLIVYCEVYSDVVASLNFAREIGLHPVARSGGHSTAGFSVNDEMVIDVTQIRHVLIDKQTQIARVGSGADFRQLNMMLDMTGLHVPGGGCETVGVSGYMMGGGYGFTSRLFGMNCDSVVGATVALANGKIVQATEHENADLYWALRGGTGSQFGVLLEIEYQLRPLDDLWGFGLTWMMTNDAEIAAATKALAGWQAGYTKGKSPAKMGHQGLLMYLDEKPQFMVRGLYNGTEQECFKELEPLFELMQDQKKQTDIWQGGRYLHLNEVLLTSVNPPGQDLPPVSPNTRALTDSRIIEDILSEDQWSKVVNWFLKSPVATNFIGLEAYGGAINDVAPGDTAFVHRTASLDMFTWIFWVYASDKEASLEYLKQFGEMAGPLSNGHIYQNYPLRGTEDFRDAFFGGNFERLLEIKQKYDPDNLFSYEQSITPRPG